MAKGRSRYKKMETVMTAVLVLDLTFFIAYLVFAGMGMTGLKVVAAAISSLISCGVLYFLYTTRELLRKRSIWMTLAAVCIILCLLVSLVARFPAPVYTLPQVV